MEGNRSSAGGVTPKGPQGGRGGGIAIWRGSATITDNSAGDAGNATGTPIANGATIKLSAQGTICIFTNQPIDLIVDVTGYTPNIP
ncbi:MAG: hypothetical protein IZT58_08070 [Actinobacteria bacterium]|nr:hypothetical protein [Actinomycetota bacterium]